MYLEELSEKVWETKNARFTAAKRMHRRHVSSTVAVALLSASVIAVNLSVFLNIDDEKKSMITIVTVVMSVFALVMSLLIAHLRYDFCENNYHQCGIELDNLNQRLKIKLEALKEKKQNSTDTNNLQEVNLNFLEEYNVILNKYSLNHTDFDHLYSSWKSGNDINIGLLQRLWLWIKWTLFDISILYWLIAIGSVVVVLIAYLNIPFSITSVQSSNGTGL